MSIARIGSRGTRTLGVRIGPKGPEALVDLESGEEIACPYTLTYFEQTWTQPAHYKAELYVHLVTLGGVPDPLPFWETTRLLYEREIDLEGDDHDAEQLP